MDMKNKIFIIILSFSSFMVFLGQTDDRKEALLNQVPELLDKVKSLVPEVNEQDLQKKAEALNLSKQTTEKITNLVSKGDVFEQLKERGETLLKEGKEKGLPLNLGDSQHLKQVENSIKPALVEPRNIAQSATDAGRDTYITSDDVEFNQKTSVVTYRNNVFIDHIDFKIYCDELEVHLHEKITESMDQSSNPDSKVKVNKNKIDPISAVAVKNNSKKQDQSIRKAYARGRLVKIEKVTVYGELQTGLCRNAIYDAAKQEIIMSDYPQIRTNQFIQKATSATTKMIIQQSGHYYVEGQSTSTLVAKPSVQNDDAERKVGE
jgi:lipopolysaccharide export system protein LptA